MNGPFIPEMWSEAISKRFEESMLRDESRWDPWAESTSSLHMRMTDGEVIPPGEPYMVRTKWVGKKLVGAEMYGKVAWVGRKLDDDNFMGSVDDLYGGKT